MNNKQVIFLVSPDRCGKTHIGHELSKRLALPYYKASTERFGFTNTQERFIQDIRYSCPARLDLLRQMNSGIVYDRGYPCEWVYSRFFDRRTDDDAIMWLDKQYANLGAVLVVPYRSSYKGLRDDLNPSIGEPELVKLHGLYDDFLKLTSCKYMKLNVDDERLDREVNEIIDFLEKI